MAVTLPAFTYAPPAHPFLTVIHQDDDVLVVDKPSGLLTVPGKPDTHKDCLEARAHETYPEARIVHRLDCETSGLVVFGRSAAAHRALSIQFQNRKVEKTYIARVWGDVERRHGPTGTIDLPLACDWPNRPRQEVNTKRGKPSITRWQVLEREDDGNDNPVTRLCLTPITGRSHQLRVHLAELGHPILGDPLYAPQPVQRATKRLHLHAQSLAIAHPTAKTTMRFTSQVPF